MPAMVQVDADLAKGKRLAPVEGDQIHAQHLRVEVSGRVEIGYGEDKVVKSSDAEGHSGIMDLRGDSWLAEQRVRLVHAYGMIASMAWRPFFR